MAQFRIRELCLRLTVHSLRWSAVQFSPTARAGGTSSCCGHQPSGDHIQLRLSSLHGSHEGHTHPR